MSNSYTDCLTSLSNVDTALQAYYGAGVTIHSSSSTTLIFSCAAVSDHVIKLVLSSSQLLAYYGDAYSGGDITNSVTWLGTSTIGTVSKIHLICCTNTIVINAFASTVLMKIAIVGKLSNDDFGVCGTIGHSSTSYNANHFAYITTDNTQCFILNISGEHQNTGGKLFKLPIYLINTSVGLADNPPPSFLDVHFVTKAIGNTTYHLGSDYFITSSGGYMDSATYVQQNSFVVEDIA